MSFRTAALRAARPALARTAAPVVGRRAASSSHQPSSNTPWALGSAAVFGSLAAFILMPAGDHAAETVHDSVEAKGKGGHVDTPGEKPEDQSEHHENARNLMRKERDAGDRPTLDDDPKGKMVHAGEARSRTEIPSKRDDEKPMRRGPSTGEDFEKNKIDPKHMQAGIANKGYNADESKIEAGDSTSSSGSKDASDVKESVEQAVKSNAPKVAAAAEEAKDTATAKASDLKDKAKSAFEGAKDAAKGATEGSEGGDEPSQEDVVDSIHQAENIAVPRAAMAEERK